jgi:arginine decarboxylase
VLAPGERISQEAVDHLTTGVEAGMLIPDAADPSMETLRVVAR